MIPTKEEFKDKFNELRKRGTSYDEVIDEIYSFFSSSNDRAVEEIKNKKKIKSQKCMNCGGSVNSTDCIGGSDWFYKDAFNEGIDTALSLIQPKEDIKN